MPTPSSDEKVHNLRLCKFPNKIFADLLSLFGDFPKTEIPRFIPLNMSRYYQLTLMQAHPLDKICQRQTKTARNAAKKTVPSLMSKVVPYGGARNRKHILKIEKTPCRFSDSVRSAPYADQKQHLTKKRVFNLVSKI